MTRKNIALVAAAAAAVVGETSAFSVAPTHALQSVQVRPLCIAPQRHAHAQILSLRASSTDAEAEKVQKFPSMAIEIETDTMGVDPAGFSYLDVKGEYTEDGWVDEEEAARPGMFSGLFGGIFGGKEKADDGTMTREELAREMDVIEFLDGSKGSLTDAVRVGTAVPFGGLNPAQIAAYKNQEEEGAEPGSNALPPLPAGWFTAQDESSGTEYYYTADGQVTWDRPTA
eukprot:CAMPEP_0196729858 /NCGR_PEP_ID=MMETSP1091-20130531/10091_1 /TAXON_ID=302021 /ORGANISM="Rhodomonas sp., Strain CCMP768" /LENGTH=227 /DNA_ID=CAMNT_0042072781 /DNA_START=37 /DNA_END=720 /DNA_ORIENTATION=-